MDLYFRANSRIFRANSRNFRGNMLINWWDADRTISLANGMRWSSYEGKVLRHATMLEF